MPITAEHISIEWVVLSKYPSLLSGRLETGKHVRACPVAVHGLVVTRRQCGCLRNEKRLLTSFHPWSALETLNPLHAVVLYTDLTFQLPPTLTISFATQVRGSNSIGYEICGFAAKDHSKINEGEVKGHQLVLLM
jgi:hypothetical protein